MDCRVGEPGVTCRVPQRSAVPNLTYGDDDYAGGTTATVDEKLTVYLAEIERADRAIAALPSRESPGAGHGRPLAATLLKMIDEYALHSGQAHMLRLAALEKIIH